MSQYLCDECGLELDDLGNLDTLQCALHGPKSRVDALRAAAANGDKDAAEQLRHHGADRAE